MLIILLLVWLLQEKRHNRNLVLAHKDTGEANKALNVLKDNLEKLVNDRTLQLTKSENQYRGLVESLEDEYVFYQHDSQEIIQYISPSVTHILGHQVSGFGSNYRQYLTDNPNNRLIANFVERCL
jgi:C4-dicarboxylate-specific signal transduction histidine kinase